ncbi:MAG TPA: hypothetical protein VGJ14_00450 [Sporichthyaceae bacterium]
MTRSIQLGMAWCGFIFVAVFFPGLIITGFFPPIPPGHSAAEVAHQYQQHANAIRAGCVIMMIAVGFSLPFSAVVSTQLARIEGRWTPLCYTQLAAGAVGMVAATFPLFFFMAASFRPDRNPEVTQAINDMGWIPFIINWPPAVCQAGAVAVAVFSDRRPDPIYPRWIGYFLLWACVAFTGSSLLLFFKHGVFAWNGLFPFWLAATFFGSFFLVMTWGTIRAVNRQFAPQSAEAESTLQPA